MSRSERRAMVMRDHPALSLSCQCRLLSIGRSSIYYAPRGESAETLALMRRIDELFLKYPFYGARQMVRHLRREGMRIGRRRAGRLMRLMGLQAVYRAPRTSEAHPEHRVYPYLSRAWRSSGRTMWCANITYIPVRRGFLYLGACAVEVLMLIRRLARGAGEVGFWPECGHLARPTLGWKSQRKAGTEEIRVSYAVDGHCALEQVRGRPAPASARGHRPHPLDVQRQAHEVPLGRTFAKPRRLNRRNRTSLIHPFGASESHLRCAYRALPAGLASFSPMRCVAGSRAGSTATWDLPSRPSATCASMPRSSSSNQIRLVAVARIGHTTAGSTPNVSLISSSIPTS